MPERPVLLIADDDEDVQRLLTLFVRPLDCEVLTARDGEEALAIAQTRLPDLVLFDRASGLPTVPMVLGRLKEMLIEQSEIGIVYVDIEQFESIEAEYGWAFFDEFLRRAGEAVAAEARGRFPKALVAANLVGGSS